MDKSLLLQSAYASGVVGMSSADHGIWEDTVGSWGDRAAWLNLHAIPDYEMWGSLLTPDSQFSICHVEAVILSSRYCEELNIKTT